MWFQVGTRMQADYKFTGLDRGRLMLYQEPEAPGMSDKKDISACNPHWESHSDIREVYADNQDVIDTGSAKQGDGTKISEEKETSPVANQGDAEEAGDSLGPMRKEWIQILKDSSVSEKAENIGKLKPKDDETNAAKPLGSAPAELLQNQIVEIHKEAPTHENGIVQRAYQQSIELQQNETEITKNEPEHEEEDEKEQIMPNEILNHNNSKVHSNVESLGSAPAELSQNQTLKVREEAPTHVNGIAQQASQQSDELRQSETEITDLHVPKNEIEHDKRDEREKIIPKEIRQKIYTIVPALLKVVEDDTQTCCSSNCSCTVSCLNICCLPCNNPLSKSEDTTEEKFHIFNEMLQRGSEAGSAIFQEIIFPLIRPFTRDIIAISEFLIGFVGLILLSISFSLGNNGAYNIIHLVLAILSTLLGFVDMIVSLKFSSAIAQMIKSLRNRILGENGKDVEANGNRYDKDPEEPSFLKKGWDTGRILISEAILYPLLVCDLIEFIVNRSYAVNEPREVVNLVLFIISLLSFVFYVYIVRVGVLIAMAIHLHKFRSLRPKPREAITKQSTDNEKVSKENNEELDPSIAKKAMIFLIYFVLHVMGQMASQIMIIVAVSLKIAEDNKNKTLDSPLHISGELWFMLTAGYIMPFLGILSFFIPTFYWVYEHQIGLCVDFLSLLMMRGIDHILFPNGEEIKEVYESIQKIGLKLRDGKKLRDDFKRLQGISFCNKLSYAFRNPLLVVACLAYSFAQIALVVVTIITMENVDLSTIIYYVISIVIGILANVYVFLVAALWIAVIVGILAIAPIIALVAGICLLRMIGQFKRYGCVHIPLVILTILVVILLILVHVFYGISLCCRS